MLFAIRNVWISVWDIYFKNKKITPFRTTHIRYTQYAHWNLIWSSIKYAAFYICILYMHSITTFCVIFFCDFLSFHFASSSKTSTGTHPVSDQRNFPSNIVPSSTVHVSNMAASSAPIGNVGVSRERRGRWIYKLFYCFIRVANVCNHHQPLIVVSIEFRKLKKKNKLFESAISSSVMIRSFPTYRGINCVVLIRLIFVCIESKMKSKVEMEGIHCHSIFVFCCCYCFIWY